MVKLLCIGINHRTAGIDLRERLAIPSRDVPEALRHLQLNPEIKEALILSTCNRLEIYIVMSAADGASCPPESSPECYILDFLAHQSRISRQILSKSLYRYSGSRAIGHIFRVSAGLDSVILGESEITAQVKAAYELAHSQGATGAVLNQLFQKALHSAKVIRSNTRIAEGQASIGSVVVSLAKNLFGNELGLCDVLLWGAGKAAEATARHLIKNGVSRLWIVNRTQIKAQDLAFSCKSGWLSWEKALSHLAHVDIAIVCTQAPHYVIDKGDLDLVMPQRNSRALCLVDLAVPRNVEPALRTYPGVRLYDIDDIRTIAQAGLSSRHDELGRCEELVRRQLLHFVDRLSRDPNKNELSSMKLAEEYSCA